MKKLAQVFAAVIVLVVAYPCLGAAENVSPRTGSERAVLHTIAGDIVLAFYPDVAPQTVAQILRLMRLGVYDMTHFHRVEPQFVVQLATAQDRLVPLRPEQQAAIQKLPLEVVKGVNHEPWSLSMARMPNNPNSAETSFSILLGYAPHLDDQYTVFGRVESGFDAILELLKVSRDVSNRPAVRLSIAKVDVYDTVESLTLVRLTPAQAVHDPAGSEAAKSRALRAALTGGIAVMMLISLFTFLAASRLAVRQLKSLHVLIVLTGAFLLVVLLQPVARQAPILGVLLFVGLLCIFKLMSRFESG
jgi:cyclophilin family peptidyl-prolyl cis-trans isomerase